MRVSDKSILHSAWIISTRCADHIMDQNMMVIGHGPVYGHPIDMTLSRGELHGWGQFF